MHVLGGSCAEGYPSTVVFISYPVFDLALIPVDGLGRSIRVCSSTPLAGGIKSERTGTSGTMYEHRTGRRTDDVVHVTSCVADRQLSRRSCIRLLSNVWDLRVWRRSAVCCGRRVTLGIGGFP